MEDITSSIEPAPALRQSVDRLIAVISGVNTTPKLLMVHVAANIRTYHGVKEIVEHFAVRGDHRGLLGSACAQFAKIDNERCQSALVAGWSSVAPYADLWGEAKRPPGRRAGQR